jgi:hypothetical protein
VNEPPVWLLPGCNRVLSAKLGLSPKEISAEWSIPLEVAQAIGEISSPERLPAVARDAGGWEKLFTRYEISFAESEGDHRPQWLARHLAWRCAVCWPPPPPVAGEVVERRRNPTVEARALTSSGRPRPRVSEGCERDGVGGAGDRSRSSGGERFGTA